MWGIVALALLLGALAVWWARDHIGGAPPASRGWELTLVNSAHAVPSDWQLQPLTLGNGEVVDERMYPSLQKLFDAARAAGLHPKVVSGYRTDAEQQELIDRKAAELRRAGRSADDAAAEAGTWVAAPGHSEHQLGLAVDISAVKGRSRPGDVHAWLAEHAHEFGFVQRYQAGKEAITGVSPEPWHYRYVGVDAANAMHSSGRCLEEHLGVA